MISSDALRHAGCLDAAFFFDVVLGMQGVA